MGFSAMARSRKAGNFSRARSSKEGLKPQKFMDTMVSPGSLVQVSPPSSVKRGGGPFSMRVRSTMPVRQPSAPTWHTPRATWP